MASWGAAAGTIHHYYSSSTTTVDDVYGDSGGIRTMLSRLSIESFDADEEFSNHKYAKDEIVLLGFSSDSDDAHQGGAAACYSLPATPPRWRYQNEVGYPQQQQQQLIGIGGKEYASENEAQKIINSNSRRQRRSLLRPERWIERDAAAAAAAAASWDHGKEVVAALGDGEDDDADDEEEEQISTGMGMEMGGGWSWSNNNNNNNSSFSGGDGESSDQSGGGGGRLMRIITKPKGGRRSICMDLEEMKACRDLGGKEYASENEAQKIINSNGRRQRRSLLRPERWIERDAVAAAAAASWDHGKEVVAALGDGEDDDADDEEEEQISTGMGMEMGGGWSWSNNNNNNNNNNSSFSGGDGESSDQSGGGGGQLMRIITKPKGGRRSICMDLEEMKACRDLGFELEHNQHMMSTPTRLSLSAASNFDTATTSSGGDSPISNWRISSPGDDPRDVKARLKVWAQAVALVSSSPRHTTTST